MTLTVLRVNYHFVTYRLELFKFSIRNNCIVSPPFHRFLMNYTHSHTQHNCKVGFKIINIYSASSLGLCLKGWFAGEISDKALVYSGLPIYPGAVRKLSKILKKDLFSETIASKLL